MTSNQIRAYLRKACQYGEVHGRTTYHDYYDSCHPPTVTPDAPFVKIVYLKNGFQSERELNFGLYYVHKRDLMKQDYSPSVRQLDENTFELSTGYKTWQLKVIKKG